MFSLTSVVCFVCPAHNQPNGHNTRVRVSTTDNGCRFDSFFIGISHGTALSGTAAVVRRVLRMRRTCCSRSLSLTRVCVLLSCPTHRPNRQQREGRRQERGQDYSHDMECRVHRMSHRSVTFFFFIFPPNRPNKKEDPSLTTLPPTNCHTKYVPQNHHKHPPFAPLHVRTPRPLAHARASKSATKQNGTRIHTSQGGGGEGGGARCPLVISTPRHAPTIYSIGC